MRKLFIVVASLGAVLALIPAIAGASSRRPTNRIEVALRAAGVTPALQARADRAVRLADSRSKSERLLRSIGRLERSAATRPYGIALAAAAARGAKSVVVHDRMGRGAAVPTSAPKPDIDIGCWYVPRSLGSWTKWTNVYGSSSLKSGSGMSRPIAVIAAISCFRAAPACCVMTTSAGRSGVLSAQRAARYRV